MHIQDGILSAQACAAYYGVTAVMIVPGFIEIKRRVEQNPYYKPFLAMAGVAVFVISAMHLPVPVTGSCSHPCGTTWRQSSPVHSPRLSYPPLFFSFRRSSSGTEA